jgi:hypothetical protein
MIKLIDFTMMIKKYNYWRDDAFICKYTKYQLMKNKNDQLVSLLIDIDHELSEEDVDKFIFTSYNNMKEGVSQFEKIFNISIQKLIIYLMVETTFPDKLIWDDTKLNLDDNFKKNAIDHTDNKKEEIIFSNTIDIYNNLVYFKTIVDESKIILIKDD